ncbi:oxidoreductase [Mycobacterium saskatchewanense]|uniref:Oxidoreductase n=1 Tax=Mycobacterium saskatchewanense TaxID=220927 RepID=A0A1X2C9H7_9MYCO|nr:NAD(P)-dependent oxidoreductase [Mycobacterium saskatchewanense]ORW72655.1 oxidoreductase [Mycobacterium saskatchewanense]BBX65992.1 oxidoreductase [Mycobacterium saskatchewanense]
MAADTVLVTGAFGQVGRRCVEILLKRGKTVVAMDLRTDRSRHAEEELASRAQGGALLPVYADLTHGAAVRDAVEASRPDAIVHLAAMLSPASYRNPGLARRVNVEGTRNLVEAARKLSRAPLFVKASSAAVYGSRNPYRYPERITAETPTNPIDQYGEDKVLAEIVVRDSGLPYALLRLGGVVSPDAQKNLNSDYLLLMRATPADNRLHAADARDVGLAFANAVDRGRTINGKVLLIGGNESYVGLQRQMEDDMMEAMGLGRLGPSAGLPGDRNDDRGWSFTGWFDTTESQALLDFQRTEWSETLSWIGDSVGWRRTMALLGPALRPTLRAALSLQRRLERRGRYADPWTLISNKYGPQVLARTGSSPY